MRAKWRYLRSLQHETGLNKKFSMSAVVSFAMMGGRYAGQLGAAVLLARLLAPAGYGRYAFVMAVANVVIIFVLLGFPGYLTREVAAGEARGDWGRIRSILTAANRTVLCGLLVVVIATALLMFFWPQLGFGERVTIGFGVAFLGFNALGQLKAGELMGWQCVLSGQLGVQVLQPGLVLLGVSGVAFVGGEQLTTASALGISAAAALVVLGANTFMVWRVRPVALRNSTQVVTQGAWWRHAVPFAIMGGVFVLNSQVDVVMLGLLAPSREVGLYRVAARGATLVTMGLAAASPVIGPAIAREHALGNQHELERTAQRGALFGLAGALPIFLMYLIEGRWILARVFGEQYTAAWLPLVVLAAGQLINAGTGPVTSVLNMTGHEKETAWILGGAAVVNILLNGILIPVFGIYGAAIATCASTILWSIALAWRIHAKLGVRLPVSFMAVRGAPYG